MTKSFIEVDFPVKEVSDESSQEKNIRHGHISTLHIWWARRPLASSRASIYAALTPEPKDEEERLKRAHFIANLSKWENSLNRDLVERAREEILKANNGKKPRVLDPFAGGGAIPLEALRLGCETHTNDLNPVPDEPTPEGKGSGAERAFSVRNYGLNAWGDLFNSRQKLALITFAEKVRLAYKKMIEDGYNEEYAKAVVSYLGFVVSRIPDTNSTVCHWDGSWEKTCTTFARQALPMNWDFIEANVLGNKGYNFKNILNTISLVLEKISGPNDRVPNIIQFSANYTSTNHPNKEGGDE